MRYNWVSLSAGGMLAEKTHNGSLSQNFAGLLKRDVFPVQGTAEALDDVRTRPASCALQSALFARE